MAFAANSRIGRLVELRLFGDTTLEEALEFERATRECIATCARRAGGPVVICTDSRDSQLLRPEVSERLVGLMRGGNRTVERNGVLGSTSALTSLQAVRIITLAESEKRRRVFTRVEALLAWLDEVLDPHEQARLREFLAEHPSSGGNLAAFGGAAPAPPTPRRPPSGD